MPNYKRILLKLSGELFTTPDSSSSFDFKNIEQIAAMLQQLLKQKKQVAVIVGAGNIFRARMVQDGSIPRVAADHMGMMATIINALALQSVLERMRIDARVLSAISMPEIVEDYVHKRAIKHLERGRVVIFAGGTGRPFFTTDTAAVERALEIKADVVFKASNVNGVYDSDPHKNSKAKLYKKITYAEALDKGLKVMDATAFALAQENGMPIKVFKYSPKNVVAAARGSDVGTVVSK